MRKVLVEVGEKCFCLADGGEADINRIDVFADVQFQMWPKWAEESFQIFAFFGSLRTRARWHRGGRFRTDGGLWPGRRYREI